MGRFFIVPICWVLAFLPGNFWECNHVRDGTFFTSVAPFTLSAWLVASHLTSSHIIIETTCSLVRLALAQQPLSEANIIFHYMLDNRTGQHTLGSEEQTVPVDKIWILNCQKCNPLSASLQGGLVVQREVCLGESRAPLACRLEFSFQGL